jgi:predicted Zn-dependent protease
VGTRLSTPAGAPGAAAVSRGARRIREARHGGAGRGSRTIRSLGQGTGLRFMRRLLTLVAGLLWISAASGGGVYESLPLRDDEWRLIEESEDLEGYFNAQSRLYVEPKALDLVRRVGHEIRPYPSDDYIEYEFFVLRDPSPNAFALPNGHVYVHTGMLARLGDEHQLAALLAHEINHVAGHHGIVNHRAANKTAIAGLVIGGLGGWGGAVISLGLQASVYGYSRNLEQEADDRAVDVLLASRYDPHAMPELLDLLGRDYEGLSPRTSTVWSTHPEMRARAETSRALVAGVERRERHGDAFEAAVMDVRAMTIEDYVQDDFPHTAVALAESLVARYPDDPRLLHLLGDAWQGMGAQGPIDTAALSNSDKRHNVRDRARKTRAQRLAEQLETEEGRTTYAANLQRAEETYQRVVALDPTYAPAYRGLGEVYEQQKRSRDAAEAYLSYVKQAPDAADRSIVVGRLRLLTTQLKVEQ